MMCDALQHTLQHTLQRTATHATTHCNTHSSPAIHILQHTLQHTLQRTATHATTHCNKYSSPAIHILQHTETHGNTCSSCAHTKRRRRLNNCKQFWSRVMCDALQHAATYTAIHTATCTVTRCNTHSLPAYTQRR